MTTNKVQLAAFAAIVVLASAATAPAISVVNRNFDELVARADTVFLGTVTSQSCVWKGEGETRRIMTLVTIQVLETYKGDAQPIQVIELLGGVVGDQGLDIPGMPKFFVGETCVLFMVENGRQICPLVGIQQGLFRVEKDPDSGEARIYNSDRQPVVDTADLGKVDDDGAALLHQPAPGAKPITVTEFRDQIVRRLNEQAAASGN